MRIKKVLFTSLAGLAVIAALLGASNIRTAQANITGGAMSLTDPAGPSHGVGSTFSLNINVDSTAGPSGDPGYESFQWLVQSSASATADVLLSGTHVAPAPLTACSGFVSKNLGDATFSGCGSATGANTLFTGQVSTVNVKCLTAGSTTVYLNTVGSFKTTLFNDGGAEAPTTVSSPLTINCVNSSDVTLTKVASDTTPDAGDTVTFTITVDNAGPDTSNALTVSDPAPAGLTYTAEDSASCSIAANTLSCSYAAQAVADPALVVNVTVDVGADQQGQTINNCATVTNAGSVLEVDPTNNQDCETLFVTDADVEITKLMPATAGVGANYVATITVTNNGPSGAVNVVVNDAAPANTTIVGVPTTTAGSCAASTAVLVDCTIGAMASGATETITVTLTTSVAGQVCNDATVTFDIGGSVTSDPSCTFVSPPFTGLVKDCDLTTPEVGPEEGCNIFFCDPQDDDGLDNDGNSTIDDEDNTCGPNGSLEISELIFAPSDCDSPNDDDDGDGLPADPCNVGNSDGVDNDGDGTIDELDEQYLGNLPPFSPLLDKDGDELPEGIGAFEFWLAFDHKIFDVQIEATAWLYPTGRIPGTGGCTMTIITENEIRFGCVSKDDPAIGGIGQGPNAPAGAIAATITLTPDGDLRLLSDFRPAKDNGIVSWIVDRNCEIADTLGELIPGTVDGGLTPDCTDLLVTVRYLEGDLDVDCDVDVVDDQMSAFRYGSTIGFLGYQKWFDLEPKATPDGDIDIKDLQVVFGRNGSTCTTPYPDQLPGVLPF